MFSYLLSRWRLARLFEPCEGGYLYRRKATAEAILVTANEKDQIFREFRSAYWKSHGVLWLSFLVGVSLLIGLAVAVDAPPETGTMIGYAIVVPLLFAVIYVDRRVFDKAAEGVADRPAVRPVRKRSQLRDEYVKKAAWWKLIAGGLFLSGFAWLTFPMTSINIWVKLGWIGYFGLCAALWGRNIWRKWQFEQHG